MQCVTAVHTMLHHDMVFRQTFKHEQIKNCCTYSVINCLNDSNAKICTVSPSLRANIPQKYFSEYETGFRNIMTHWLSHPWLGWGCKQQKGYNFLLHVTTMGTAAGTALQIRRSLVRSQMVSLEFFIGINSSDRTMALGSTQPLTEMSTRSISWG
jgi:hypothetical protein